MYFIYTFDIKNVEETLRITPDRVSGFFETFEEAEEAILKNLGDMIEENRYPYALIEKVQPGIYGETEVIKVYKTSSRNFEIFHPYHREKRIIKEWFYEELTDLNDVWFQISKHLSSFSVG